jgi:hypothetical protein
MALRDLPLVATAIAATATDPPKNKLTWDLPIVWASPPNIGDGVLVSYHYRALFLQRSASAFNIPAAGRNYLTTHSVPLIEARWKTIRAWDNSELPGGPELVDPSTFPVTYEDPVTLSTFYYYRLIFIGRASATVGQYKQLNWNVAKIVQPYVVNGGQMHDQNHDPVNFTRLNWDAPTFVDPNFNFTVIRSTSNACNGPCHSELRWTWPFTAPPTNYSLYKSYDNQATWYLAVPSIANNFTQPFYDTDAAQPLHYKLVANTPDGATSTYDVKANPA